MEILFAPEQIKAAARFLEQHNNLCDQPAEVWEKHIYESIKTYADDPEISLIGTGGYMVQFAEAGEDMIDVSVYIDPSVGMPTEFITAELKEGKMIREF